jgi:2'-5' RNA ligase
MDIEKKSFRIFIGLPIGENLQDKILKFEKKFKNLPVRWILSHNLHITLVPPWYENDIERIKEKLKFFDLGKSFKISFYKVEYGPSKKFPRLIWAVGDTPKELLILRQNLFNILNQKPEQRDFKLHLTLARFNFNPKIKLPEINESVYWEDEIKEVVLFHSHLLKTGAEYEVIERFKMRM